MSFEFECPLCGVKRLAASALEGRRARCPECHEMVVIGETIEAEKQTWQSEDFNDSTMEMSSEDLQAGLAASLHESLVDDDDSSIFDDPVSDDDVEATKIDQLPGAPIDEDANLETVDAEDVENPANDVSDTKLNDTVEMGGLVPLLDESVVDAVPAADIIPDHQAEEAQSVASEDARSSDAADESEDEEDYAALYEEQPRRKKRDDDDGPVVLKDDAKAGESEMDMTPMVDVTFLLLIFFMVTAAFAVQKVIEVPAPQEEEASTNAQTMEEFEEDPDVIIVKVDAFNTYQIITPDAEEEAPSKQDLIIKLRSASGGMESGGPTSMLVMANGEAYHSKVIDAIDAGATVGIKKVSLVTVEEDDE